MPPPVRRLNLRICAADPERHDAAALLEAWLNAGIDRARVVEGGAERLRVVEMPTLTFLSCGQGGFRTLCPIEGRPVFAFPKALTAWRVGGPRSVVCDCGLSHDLAALSFVPEAAFAKAWIEVDGAQSDTVIPAAMVLAEARWGEVRVVRHRG